MTNVIATPQPRTARQQLGEVIAFRLSQQRRTDRDVASRCGVSLADVERFRAGLLVPEQKTWRRMCEMVSRSLHAHQALYNTARAEQQAEHDLALRGLQRMTRPVTNLGDKIRSASAPDTPDQPAAQPPQPSGPTGPKNPGAYAGASRDLGQDPPGYAKDGRALSPPRADGTMTHEAKQRRRDFVREILKVRPHAPASGRDGIVVAVRKMFGVGIDPGAIELIRAELEHEVVKASAPPPEQSTVPTPAVEPRTVREAEVVEAVELVVSTIPGLRRMTIEINGAGEASYSYEVQAVQTGGGSVAVRR